MASRTQPRHEPGSVSDHAVLGRDCIWWVVESLPGVGQPQPGVGRGSPWHRYGAEEAEWYLSWWPT